jgi:hypothetical protein
MLSFLPPEITAAGTTLLPRRFNLYHEHSMEVFDTRNVSLPTAKLETTKLSFLAASFMDLTGSRHHPFT